MADVTNPMPFLATMTGASAGMFSIVAGFLVSRFVSLDSEQQTNEHELAELEEDLAMASRRAETSRAAWVRFEANLVFEDEDVLNAVSEGHVDADRLRRLGPTTPLSDDELQQMAQEVRQHYVDAFDTLKSLIHEIPDISNASADHLNELRDWYKVRAAKGVPSSPDWPEVWEHALQKVVDPLVEEAEAKERSAQRPLAGGFQIPRPFIPPSPSIPVVRSIQSQETSRRRVDLEASLNRAEQHVEDLLVEIDRVTRRSVVIPVNELIRALCILATMGVLGILLPLFSMSQGPDEFTPEIKLLRWTFLFAFLLLVGYLASFAARLWRRVRKLTGRRS